MTPSRSIALGSFLILFAAIGMTAAAPRKDTGSRASSDHPNLVFIVADDLGYGEIGVYGQEKIKTPNLDRMARQGMLFTDFYAGSTVCAPARSVLMTGLHMGHTPIRGNKPDPPIGQAPLPDKAVTVAEVLQKAGYATGAYGKWGLGGPGSEGMPTKQGFDEFFGYLGQTRAHFYYPEFLFHNGERVPLEGNKVVDNPARPGAGHSTERNVYSHDRIVDEALSFLDNHQKRPFFLFLPFTLPHVELLVPESSLKAYQDEQGQSIFPETPYPGGHFSAQPMPHATQAAMISRLDQSVGIILHKLEELGLEKDTLVIFTSDNGPTEAGGADPEFFNSGGPLRGIKRDLYEGGIRVPTIARWPGKIEPGTITHHVAYFGDLMATAADLANIQAPDNLDSISFLPTLLGHADKQKKHDYLYWEFYEQGSKQAVRMGKWKAVRMPAFTGDIELYNLEKDLGEANNVADQHPDVAQKIKAIMKKAHTPDKDWQPLGKPPKEQPKPGSGKSPFASRTP